VLIGSFAILQKTEEEKGLVQSSLNKNQVEYPFEYIDKSDIAIGHLTCCDVAFYRDRMEPRCRGPPILEYGTLIIF